MNDKERIKFQDSIIEKLNNSLQVKQEECDELLDENIDKDKEIAMLQKELWLTGQYTPYVEIPKQKIRLN